ncbi:M24 family metallopeptidase [Micromonospora sp. NPDC048830]|uniref:M24 family metallopeptidase n=1 Tax=Micromonospora sp. NPDC048830 TaxID=3364257 RepID=UPI0037223632
MTTKRTTDNVRGRVTDTEFARRHGGVKAIMERLDLTATVVCGRDDETGIDRGRFHYVTDFEALNGQWFAVLFRDSGPVIFQPAYVGRAWADYASRIRDIVVAVDQAADIASLLKERGSATGRVGVVGLGDVMKVDDLRTLERLAPAAELVDVTAELDQMMAIKSDEEIGYLEETGEMCRRAFDAIAEAIRPGVTERYVTSKAFQVIKEMGGTTGFIHVARSGGIRTFHPPTDDVLERGDVIGFDLEHKGPSHYGVEVAHYFSVGPAPAEYVRKLDAEMRVFTAAREALRPGADAGAVMDAMSAAAAKSGMRMAGPVGLGPVMFHGHGVGLNFFCPPYVPGDGPIEAGMVLALHPWTGPERGDKLAVTALDTVVVDEDVSRSLVLPARGLIER